MKLVLFDCDGTLVDSQAMIVASLTRAFEIEGLAPPSRAQMLSIVGLSLINAMRVLAPDETSAKQEALSEAYKASFWKYREEEIHGETLFPGAMDVLNWLHTHPHVRLGIATGKSRRGVDRLLAHHNLEGRFITIQTADSAPSKPDPAMILNAMAEADIGPESTVMIGDATYDLDMANAAGVKSIGVSWGFMPRPALEACNPHSIINNFNELEGVLQQIFPELAP